MSWPVAASAALLLTLAVHPAPAPLRADRIVVEKAQRRLTLYSHGRSIKAYRVALGASPLGAKTCEGDHRTPEGKYIIDSRLRASMYHRALHVSYPNGRDARNARAKGCRPGGAIMIHGLPNGSGAIGKLHAQSDWTAGCIAVTNEEIEEIWNAVANGTEVEIKP